ncbi:S8 family serine peptidase [Nonomuraea sp. K274]|uniref:S8 family serine peptidase n=1 Tax=Nonomuraea cypriaca TaxID=1187855 RepID=A0A931AF09_9ACTN|nr:S8 family serine peptidase [Nonomuraea cypriaca]MBF8189879.1 S8 family serine peptidase [Nonomuraea cypriaca]
MRLRSLLASACALAFTMTAAVAVSAPAQAAAGDPEVAPNITSEVKSGDEVRAIIELKAGQSVAAVADKAEAASGGTDVVNETISDEFLVVNVDKKTLDTLKTDTRVAAIYEDRLSPVTLDVSTKVIGSDKANASGWTGKGYSVAVLDTGIDRNHPFFAGRITAEACFSITDPNPAYLAKSLCPNGQASQTGAGAADAETAQCMVGSSNACYHGTHVAGIAAGKKTGNVTFSGVAPDAGIVPIQVFTRLEGPICAQLGGQTPCFGSFTSSQKAALQWLQANHAGVVAANMSLGGGPKQTQACDTNEEYGALTGEISALLGAGVATVVASGNEDHTDGVASPACISSAVTVGATDNTDGVASFGNRGRLLDLFAPGVDINSAIPNGYASLDGTSMAAPHVAGALAVMKQAYPNRDATWLVNRLRTTGKAITYPSGNRNVTTRRIDLAAAVPPGPTTSPTPTPTVTPTGTPTATPTGRPTRTPTTRPTTPPSSSPKPTSAPEQPQPTYHPENPDANYNPVPVPDTCKRGKGKKPLSAKAWATEMLRSKGSLSDATLFCYIQIAQKASKVFPELTNAGSVAKAYKVLNPKSKAAKALIDRELLASWLNYAHGVYNTSGKVYKQTTLKQALSAAERHRTGKSTSASQLKKSASYLYKHVNK